MKLPFNITYVLMAINVAVFLVAQNQPALLGRMTFMINRVKKYREYDRLFLSGFAHAGFLHLLFNMVTLYFFGPFVESAIGATLFLILYLLSIIGGNLYCMFMRREDYGYAALGASGGVLGVIYATIFIEPHVGLSLFLLPVSIPGWLFGILFSIISIWLTQLSRADEARISHEGHLGGALTGGMFVMVLLAGSEFSVAQWYFIIGGIIPLILFPLVKLVAPGLLYRHLR